MEQDISISLALFELKPDAQWTLIGTNYSDIEWTDTVHTKPTEEEINAKILEMKLSGVIEVEEFQKKISQRNMM